MKVAGGGRDREPYGGRLSGMCSGLCCGLCCGQCWA